jgi:endonuclease/exonuclease/phosphatase family metal-dependent hydrolase
VTARVRIATFNIRHGRRVHGRVDIGRTARVAAACEADVLALQEVDVRTVRAGFADQAERIAREMGATFVFGTTMRRNTGWYGNALVVRGDIPDSLSIELPRRSREPRGAIVASVHVRGAALAVAATHLSTHRDEAVEQLEFLVGQLVERPAPRVLLGDLNLHPDVVRPIVEAHGLALVEHEPTFSNERPGSTIDHVASTGVDVVACEVRATASSDHRALLVDAEVP